MVTKLYVVFLGLLMALFVGVGIAAFYKAPKAPEYPTRLEKMAPAQTDSSGPSADQLKAEKDYEALSKKHQEAYEAYSRNVSLLALAAAILLVALGLFMLKNVHIITDGTLLGGVFTLSYSIIRGFGAQDDAFRFLLVSVSLIVAVTLGYFKFIKPLEHAKRKR